MLQDEAWVHAVAGAGIEGAVFSWSLKVEPLLGRSAAWLIRSLLVSE